MSISKFILKYRTKHPFIFTMITNQDTYWFQSIFFANTPNIEINYLLFELMREGDTISSV